MKISTKGRYALRLMLGIALRSEGEPVSLRDVAKQEGISDKYLEQIVTPLNRAGLVRSVRGAGGGYLLTRPAQEYTVGEILRVLEGRYPVPTLPRAAPGRRSASPRRSGPGSPPPWLAWWTTSPWPTWFSAIRKNRKYKNLCCKVVCQLMAVPDLPWQKFTPPRIVSIRDRRLILQPGMDAGRGNF